MQTQPEPGTEPGAVTAVIFARAELRRHEAATTKEPWDVSPRGRNYAFDRGTSHIESPLHD